jgi:heme-degrading monooxygenase HmoA
MIMSILSRKTAVSSREEWETRLGTMKAHIESLLTRQPGYVSHQFLYSADSEGDIMQVTVWQSLDDCRAFLRGGAAAMVGTMEDAVLPSAPYPYGNWYRRNFEVPEGATLV